MVEQIKYEVVKKRGQIEIRRYPRLVIARVDGYGDDGFNNLFQYISGNNRQKTRLVMTAPVVTGIIVPTSLDEAPAVMVTFVL